ncbi:MAG: DNA/RNA non-specific endonuclease [Clostridia bacterium]|nr:DNA/RNA non-specific endonuclease [Clostridia bacterium]
MKSLLRLGTSLLALLLLLATLTGCLPFPGNDGGGSYEPTPLAAFEVRNDNIPYFTPDEIVSESYEHYSPLDSLGRCGVAMACIGTDLMPKEGEKRGSISDVKPSGWEQEEYDPELVDGGYLYNRAHLIGWQLTAENANRQNLITGTKYMNNEGMLPFENMVADYLKGHRSNHVMYRVTPEFKGNNLVASGVLMEAYSVEDGGAGICFCVYVFNYQPGIVINYADGTSALGETTVPPDSSTEDGVEDGEGTITPGGGELPEESETFILNTSTKRYHKPTCSGVSTMKEENKQEYTGTREDLEAEGYVPCGTCKP